MYYIDTLLRFGITPEEISKAYVKKHCKNMGRDYSGEYEKMYTNKNKALTKMWELFCRIGHETDRIFQKH